MSKHSLFFLIFSGAMAASPVQAEPPPSPAPGYSPLTYKLAKPGSYSLPVIARAGNGEVVTGENRDRTLYDLMGGKLVLLSFVYTACSDVNGCPLAARVMHKISLEMRKQPELAGKLRLLTLSFNPRQDTPAVMRHFGESLNSEKLDWHFLTTRSERQLQPILDSYQQNVQAVNDDKGQFTGTFTHLLRVYLIDADKNIRNIYNADLLHADAVLNDVKTLLASPPPARTAAMPAETPYRPGDDKQNYQQTDYRTRSLALPQRQGRLAKLINYALKPPLGLPKPPPPTDNPLTPLKIELGRKLFYDRRLSFNNTLSCAMCHIPEQGFGNNEMATAVGVEGRSVRRNAPSLYNVGYAKLLFHDGRENSLPQQAWGPLLAHNEMANPSISFVLDKINGSADYRGLFERAFHKPAGMETLGQALASYQLTLNSADSAFDRWYYGKQANALDPQAQRGFALFTGKAGCSGCHTVGANDALFTDQQRHNTGIGYLDSMGKPAEKQHLQVAPGIFIDVDNQQLQSLAEPKASDLGYYEISQNPADRWSYKTPSLRNVALSPPYMHNGSLPTLEAVVRFYNQGGGVNENLSPLIKPLGLSDAEIADLVALLNSLTGSNVDSIVRDAFSAPVGDSR